jgi:hypothetical protein
LAENYKLFEEESGKGKVLSINNINLDEIYINGKNCNIRMSIGGIEEEAKIYPEIVKQNKKWQKFTTIVLSGMAVFAIIALGYIGWLAASCSS